MPIEFQYPARDEKYVSRYSKDLLQQCMKASGLAKIIITSTYRSPEDQARVMLDNLSPTRTMYRGPGQDVEALGKQYARERAAFEQGSLYGFNPNKPLPTTSQPRRVVEAAMAARIHRHEAILGPGCVSHHQLNPIECNVIDISPRPIPLPILQKFVGALTSSPLISRIGLPACVPKTHPKHFRETARCLHVEIPQFIDKLDGRVLA